MTSRFMRRVLPYSQLQEENQKGVKTKLSFKSLAFAVTTSIALSFSAHATASVGGDDDPDDEAGASAAASVVNPTAKVGHKTLSDIFETDGAIGDQLAALLSLFDADPLHRVNLPRQMYDHGVCNPDITPETVTKPSRLGVPIFPLSSPGDRDVLWGKGLYEVVVVDPKSREVVAQFSLPDMSDADQRAEWQARIRMLYLAELLGDQRARLTIAKLNLLYKAAEGTSLTASRQRCLDLLERTAYSNDANKASALFGWLNTRMTFLGRYIDVEPSTEMLERFIYEVQKSMIFSTSMFSSMHQFPFDVTADQESELVDHMTALWAIVSDLFVKSFDSLDVKTALFTPPAGDDLDGEFDGDDEVAKATTATTVSTLAAPIPEDYLVLQGFVREYSNFVGMMLGAIQVKFPEESEGMLAVHRGRYSLMQLIHSAPHDHEALLAAATSSKENMQIYYSFMLNLMTTSSQLSMSILSHPLLKTDRFGADEDVPEGAVLAERLTEKVSLLRDLLDNYYPGMDMSSAVLLKTARTDLSDMMEGIPRGVLPDGYTLATVMPHTQSMALLIQGFQQRIENTKAMTAALTGRFTTFEADLIRILAEDTDEALPAKTRREADEVLALLASDREKLAEASADAAGPVE